MEHGQNDPPREPSDSGWLPPEPPGGGEPLWSPPAGPAGAGSPGQPPPGSPQGSRPPAAPPGSSPYGSPPSTPPAGSSLPNPAWGQPTHGQGSSPPNPAWGQPTHGQGYSQGYGYGQPPYAGPPYGGGYGQQQPYGYGSPYAATAWQQAEPDNSPAVAGFVLSITSLGTLILFFGFLSPINLCVSIAGIFVSRNGVKKVERGDTRRNKDLAKWGFWLGIVGAVLAALAIAMFIAIFASDPNWLEDLEDTEPR